MGRRVETAATQQASDTASASQVASLNGNVTLTAGERYRQSGSQVLALANGGNPAAVGDISITAKHVNIEAAASTQSAATQNTFSQSGLTVAMSNPLLTALQTRSQLLRLLRRQPCYPQKFGTLLRSY